eukprot:106830_1
MIPLIFSSLACMIISQIIFTIQSTINMQQSHQYQCICPIKSYTNHILRSSACMVCLTELRDQGAPGSIFDGKGEFRLRFIELLDDIAPSITSSIIPSLSCELKHSFAKSNKQICGSISNCNFTNNEVGATINSEAIELNIYKSEFIKWCTYCTT